MACTFCHTGTQPLVRNLTSREIVSQILWAKTKLFDFGSKTASRIVTNIVFMGQGEPLYNYTNLIKALNIIGDGSGISISRRKIVVSTSGVVPNIIKLANDPNNNGLGLAISLHAVNNELRDKIVPINKKWNIEELLKACSEYSKIHATTRLLFEYVMLKGINDSIAEAKELARLIKPIHGVINLIPFNPWPGAPYESSSTDKITEFANAISSDVNVAIRWPRGRDISAACGQLKTQHETNIINTNTNNIPTSTSII